MLSRPPSVVLYGIPTHKCIHFWVATWFISHNTCPVFILTYYLKCSHHRKLRSLLERFHLDQSHQASFLAVLWTLLRCLKAVCWVDSRVSFGLERCKGKLKLGVESSSHGRRVDIREQNFGPSPSQHTWCFWAFMWENDNPPTHSHPFLPQA